MRKIVVTGAECSGKTTLACSLALHLNAPQVPEMARVYLDGLGRSYREDDLLAIGKLQLRAEDEAAQEGTGASLVICDTDLITIRIWGEEKFGRSDPWIIEQAEGRPYHLWLLCRPDIPWEFDPQRENPHDRERLFNVYEGLLGTLGKPYVIIGGDREERMRQALAAMG